MSTGDQNTLLSRAELLDLVWSTPITKIAENFHVPVTAVVKACAHLNVPRPSAGHWSAVNFGVAPERPTLAPLAAGRPESTTLAEWGRRNRRQSQPKPVTNPAQPQSPVPSPETLLHPIAAKTQAAFHGGKTDFSRGVLFPKQGKQHIALSVRPELLERAVGILSQLLSKLEAKGFTFVPDPKQPDLLATIHAQTQTTVRWNLFEPTERYERELKADEKDREWVFDRWR